MTITALSGVGEESSAAVAAAAANKKRLNERFHGQAGRGSILNRLGGRTRTDSGDSLERDTGEDLRGEMAEGRAANMLIQVGV